MPYNVDVDKNNYFMKEFNTGCQKSCSKRMEDISKQEKYMEYFREEKFKK